MPMILKCFCRLRRSGLCLVSVLDLYRRASNAKVNISKTVLVSLSGVSHSAWVALADSAGLQWHDLSPALWRLFWSLDMPAKAFTPWWRLLHNRVGHRSWCHRIVPEKVVSPVCALCGLFEEDLYHFVVGCHVKSFFWQDVVSLLSLQELFPSDASIWVALTSLGDSDCMVFDEDVLVALGAAYSTLWKYHWRCVIDEEPWIASAVLNMVRQDHGSLFSSLSLASVQTGTLTLPILNL